MIRLGGIGSTRLTAMLKLMFETPKSALDASEETYLSLIAVLKLVFELTKSALDAPEQAYLALKGTQNLFVNIGPLARCKIF